MDDMVEMHRNEARALAELDRMKSEFVSVVSHELRTPLTSIKGGVHTLKRGWSEIGASTKMELLDSMTRQCDRLSNMIEKILLVSGISRDGLGLDPMVFRLDQIVIDSVRILESKASGRHVAFSPEEIEATGDPTRLTEVLVALLDNALTFTQGRIEIETGHIGEMPFVRIGDEGPGMHPAVLDRLLNSPFVQGDSSSTRSVGGLGLSLYVARQVIEASGGKLEVVTTPETGTAFTIVLPAPTLTEHGSRA